MMGRVITSLVDKRQDELEIVAGVDIAQSKYPAPFPTYLDISDCDMPADVIIDFSTAEAVSNVLSYAVKTNTNIVVCTTGLSADTEKKIVKSSEQVAVFKSANMSLGINLLNNLLKRAAGILYEEGFDVEIMEKHHKTKIDAPSGTALMLANTVNEALNNKLEFVYDRSPVRKKRGRNELGLHALRGGTIVGEHSVVFAGRDECLELTHAAYSKEVFAVGALKAAKFLKGKPPGLYCMDDIMNEMV